MKTKRSSAMESINPLSIDELHKLEELIDTGHLRPQHHTPAMVRRLCETVTVIDHEAAYGLRGKKKPPWVHDGSAPVQAAGIRKEYRRLRSWFQPCMARVILSRYCELPVEKIARIIRDGQGTC